MTILIVYASNSGGTQLTAQLIGAILKRHNHQAVVQQVRQTKPEDLASYDLIMLGSPSWDFTTPEGRKEGQPHEDMRNFMNMCKGKSFAGKRFAVFGLGDSSYMYFSGAVSHLEKFTDEVQGKRIVDSLMIDGFFFDQEKNEQRIGEWTETIVAAMANNA